MEKNTHEYARTIADAAANALDGKKALDINVLTVEKSTALADFFVIAAGTSSTHIKALADETEFKVKENLGVEPTHIEGADDKTWILLDYGCVVVHVFTRQARDYYKLDKLWADAGASSKEE
ncbi:MAG: ribosome silencing factor [Clostridia bacterium]|nr:ribosome silencing factor [Clostridia bacterium]